MVTLREIMEDYHVPEDRGYPALMDFRVAEYEHAFRTGSATIRTIIRWYPLGVGFGEVHLKVTQTGIVNGRVHRAVLEDRWINNVTLRA